MSVTVTTPRVPLAEKAALEDLLQSEGWQLFESAMREQWSATSFEAEIRQAMEEAPTGSDVTPIIGQINATYAGMRQMLDWPREQVRTLEKAPTARPKDRFALFRRGPQVSR